MINITDKTKCCGCTACFICCPSKAIHMAPDEEGFLYPKVDVAHCIACGKCEKVCPILNTTAHEEKTKGYIVRYQDSKIVEESTSGGAFTALAKHALGAGATVYGAGYDEDMQVVCKAACHENDLLEMRGSKFVQSNLGQTFAEIKNKLHDGKVLFTGTPCQVAGLVHYLGSKPENLICVDFVCRGVPSPGLWRNYLRFMEKKYGAKVVAAKFKNKTYGYHATTMRVELANGKVWLGSGRVDPMMKAFVNELASRPSCHACAFKTVERLSDITMFDCYQFSKITKVADDDKGYTSLLIHSAAGEKLFEEIRECLLVYPANVDEMVECNGIMVKHSAKANPKRDELYRLAATLPLDEAMQRVSPITQKDYAVEAAKTFLFRAGLIQMVKKIRKERYVETEK